MQLQFDKNQSYQLRAIQSIVGLFEGQQDWLPDAGSKLQLKASGKGATVGYIYHCVRNELAISPIQIRLNLNEIQKQNGLPATLETDFEQNGLNFSVEMETGTGKTYVYLRTVYELYRVYGFRKFVIVVPSVAIREGVMKNLQITHEHFQDIYGVNCDFDVYDSSKQNKLRNFAQSDTIQILVINIDSFAKSENVINKERESGIAPIQFIQAVRPIVIIDEPQNMETDKRKEAIEKLHGLCTLRYSATHKTKYNLAYRLTPVDAYNEGLVKQIEVHSVLLNNNFNTPYIKFVDFIQSKGRTKTSRLGVKLEIFVKGKEGTQKKVVNAIVGASLLPDESNLYYLSNRLDNYAEKDYWIDEVNVAEGWVRFSNGDYLYKGQTQGGLNDSIMREQIKDTIEKHLEKSRLLVPQGIKVLSIFFVDKVKNYRQYDAQGNPSLGKFAEWFEELYAELTTQQSLAFEYSIPFKAREVHNGYFSQDKNRFVDTSGETKRDDDTYNLIMKDKERLLDINEPLQFIFSHTALREGWDNPNVFQICTLNETNSEIKKRQEIGRGLRLCVNQKGVRITDRDKNKLTIIANEKYEDFAKNLQKEYEEQGLKFDSKIVQNAREQVKVTIREGLDKDPNFMDIWRRITYQTRYNVQYDSQKLIEKASREIHMNMPRITRPILEKITTSLYMNEKGVGGDVKNASFKEVSRKKGNEEIRFEIPDFLKQLQAQTKLSRNTLVEILTQSTRLTEIFNNPQKFIDEVGRIINRCLNEIIIEGIEYEKIAEDIYSMEILKPSEAMSYISNLEPIKNPHKTIYDYIQVDSNVERNFVQECDTRDDVSFYFKLPKGKFYIRTPIGKYSPDWALILTEEDSIKKMYFVVETKHKNMLDNPAELSLTEAMKIKCGRKHYMAFKENEVTFEVGSTVDDIKKSRVES